jgi:hypothetical protein
MFTSNFTYANTRFVFPRFALKMLKNLVFLNVHVQSLTHEILKYEQDELHKVKMTSSQFERASNPGLYGTIWNCSLHDV